MAAWIGGWGSTEVPAMAHEKHAFPILGWRSDRVEDEVVVYQIRVMIRFEL